MDANGEVKSEDKKYLNITVRNQSGEDVQFKVKLTTKFSKIFEAYSAKKGVSGYRFLFDGHRLDANETPADADMEDGDVIDAVLEQLGGAVQHRQQQSHQ